MTLVALGAGADGLVVGDLAVGSGAAGAHTRVGAAQLEAGLVGAALRVAGTLRVAAGQAVTAVVLRAAADGSVVDRLTARPLATGALRTRVTAPVLQRTGGGGGGGVSGGRTSGAGWGGMFYEF